MITPLPKWVLVNKFPAFYETESLTAVEQTARLYGKMNELIESYNKYVEEINKSISDLETEKHADVQEFICRISCLTDNYINTVDMKIAHQDRKISEVYSQFSEDIINTFKLFLSDLHTTGELDNAIYEALDNIKVKVDNFIAECEQFKAEMTADYESIKAGLNADYTEKKAALEGDYNTVKGNLESDYTEKKAALEGDYNTVKAVLEGDYNTVKGNLESDYTEKKAALEGDYNTVKAGLETDYEETKIQLMDDVAGYTDMYNNKGAVLYDCANDVDHPEGLDSTSITGMTIQGLTNYNLFIINCNQVGNVICSGVSRKNISDSTEQILTRISGRGIHSELTQSNVEFLVRLKITDGVIGAAYIKSYMYHGFIDNVTELDVTVTTEDAKITKIIGII